MIWRKKRRDRAHYEAVEARKRAEVELMKTREQTPRYRELAASLKELREHNNFAAAIETSFRGGRP